MMRVHTSSTGKKREQAEQSEAGWTCDAQTTEPTRTWARQAATQTTHATLTNPPRKEKLTQ